MKPEIGNLVIRNFLTRTVEASMKNERSQDSPNARNLQILCFKIVVFHPADPYLCAKFQKGMTVRLVKSLLVLIFSLFSRLIFAQGRAQHDNQSRQSRLMRMKLFSVMFWTLMSFIFFLITTEWQRASGYYPLTSDSVFSAKRLIVFMSSKFRDGEENYKGYSLNTV